MLCASAFALVFSLRTAWHVPPRGCSAHSAADARLAAGALLFRPLIGIATSATPLAGLGKGEKLFCVVFSILYAVARAQKSGQHAAAHAARCGDKTYERRRLRSQRIVDTAKRPTAPPQIFSCRIRLLSRCCR